MGYGISLGGAQSGGMEMPMEVTSDGHMKKGASKADLMKMDRGGNGASSLEKGSRREQRDHREQPATELTRSEMKLKIKDLETHVESMQAQLNKNTPAEPLVSLAEHDKTTKDKQR